MGDLLPLEESEDSWLDTSTTFMLPNKALKIINLNVGGQALSVCAETMSARADGSKITVLAQRLRGEKRRQEDRTLLDDVLYLAHTDQYFIERPPEDVELVAQYCMSGTEQQASIVAALQPPSDAFDTLLCGGLRRRIWAAFEEQQTESKASKLISFISMVFIVVSISGLIVGSMPTFQRDPPSNTTVIELGPREPIPLLVYLEYFCVGWFSFEFFIRLIVCPDKMLFVRTPLNIVDAATVLPFFMETLMPLVGVDTETLKRVTGIMLVVRTLRVLRVARLFKLARYSSSLQIMGDSFRTSIQELSMMLILLGTGVIFFATILYFLENDVPNGSFDSIPASCWWCVVTMTTVGYGDVVPFTAAGKMVAAVASICGMIVLAFPISMVVEKFATAQEQLEQRATRSKKSLVTSLTIPNANHV